MAKEEIKFTTPAAALKELMANGTDSDTANKVVAVASIIKAFTKNVMIDIVSWTNGEVWFYVKNTSDEERFNNAMAYKVLVNLIDPKIKVGALLWNDPNTTGTHHDTIDVNFKGYTYRFPGEQAEEYERAEKEAREQGREYARQAAEMCLKIAAERLEQAGKGGMVEAEEQTQEWSMDEAIERSMDEAIERSMDEDIREQDVECAFDDDE